MKAYNEIDLEKHFALAEKGKALWESMDDFEDAKEEAFVIMEEYIWGHAKYWNKLYEDLENLRGDVAV